MDHTEQQPPDWEELARQLSCPDGDNGIKTGHIMSQVNGNMTAQAIKKLQLQDGEQVLEVGPGNGNHLAALLNQAVELQYTGIDISPTMIAEANRINEAYTTDGRARFEHTDGLHIDKAAGSFDKIFTVNTLYFWKEPAAYAAELARVLKPGGVLVLAFAPESFMKDLPFVQYGFNLYGSDKVKELLEQAGLTVTGIFNEQEQVMSNTGEMTDRTYVLVKAEK